jgi:Astacin (Peptidase family M12A)
MNSKLATTAASLVLSLWISNPSFSHEFLIEQKNSFPDIVTSSSGLPVQPGDLVAVRSVIDQFKLWESGQPLQVCFFGGEPAVRAFFVEISSIWDKAASINFDFGPSPAFRDCDPANPSHIRVAFAKDGNWSYVGTDSINFALTSSSLNIELPASFALANKRAIGGTILHELGHALAMQHEHQSPESNCEAELNWPLVYTGLAARGWDQAMVDHNLRPLVASPRLRITAYDRKSIMHYSLPKAWFFNGDASACWIEKNNDLSPLDLASIAEAYPVSPQMQDQFIAGLDMASAATISKLQLSTESQSAIQAEINKAIGTVKSRKIQSELSINIGKISTMGDCSPVKAGGGDMTLNCTFGTTNR